MCQHCPPVILHVATHSRRMTGLLARMTGLPDRSGGYIAWLIKTGDDVIFGTSQKILVDKSSMDGHYCGRVLTAWLIKTGDDVIFGTPQKILVDKSSMGGDYCGRVLTV